MNRTHCLGIYIECGDKEQYSKSKAQKENIKQEQSKHRPL